MLRHLMIVVLFAVAILFCSCEKSKPEAEPEEIHTIRVSEYFITDFFSSCPNISYSGMNNPGVTYCLSLLGDSAVNRYYSVGEKEIDFYGHKLEVIEVTTKTFSFRIIE